MRTKEQGLRGTRTLVTIEIKAAAEPIRDVIERQLKAMGLSLIAQGTSKALDAEAHAHALKHIASNVALALIGMGATESEEPKGAVTDVPMAGDLPKDWP